MSSKNTYFFSHDANAHEDDKIICLMSEYGSQGYGWWWMLVETLFQQEGYILDMSKKSTVPHLFRMLWDMPIKDIPEFIDYLVDIELLKRDGDIVYSESLLKRTEKIDDLRQKRKAAAEARWGKVREKKEKAEARKTEAREPSTTAIDELRNDKKFNEWISELMKKEPYSSLTLAQIRTQRDSCLDWLASKGAVKKDYKAFFRNWLRKYIESAPPQQKNNNGNQMVY